MIEPIAAPITLAAREKADIPLTYTVEVSSGMKSAQFHPRG
jgi:hypothetical protein